MAEDLTAGIEEDAEKEAVKLLTEAQRRVDETVGAAEKRAAAIIREAEEAAETGTDSLNRHALRSVENDIKKRELASRDALHREVLSEVKRRMEAMVGYPKYQETLVLWLREACLGLSGKELVLYPGSLDAKQFTDSMLREMESELSVKIRRGEASQYPCRQGCIVSTSDGTMLYDNSLRARMRRLSNALRRTIDQELA